MIIKTNVVIKVYKPNKKLNRKDVFALKESPDKIISETTLARIARALE
jgi:hypothetical protein